MSSKRPVAVSPRRRGASSSSVERLEIDKDGGVYFVTREVDKRFTIVPTAKDIPERAGKMLRHLWIEYTRIEYYPAMSALERICSKLNRPDGTSTDTNTASLEDTQGSRALPN